MAPNGEVVASSELYNSWQAAFNGIKAVQEHAPVADVHHT